MPVGGTNREPSSDMLDPWLWQSTHFPPESPQAFGDCINQYLLAKGGFMMLLSRGESTAMEAEDKIGIEEADSMIRVFAEAAQVAGYITREEVDVLLGDDIQAAWAVAARLINTPAEASGGSPRTAG